MSQAAADSLVVEAQALFREERFAEAATRFEKAAQLFPAHPHAWKGLGQTLLCLHKPHEATRAFDQAIGLAPTSATALWGGAVAHAEVGNKVVALSYLRRTLKLQPTWIEMARDVPTLAAFLRQSTRTTEDLRAVFGAFSTRTYRHAADDSRAVEVGRIIDQPAVGKWSFVTIGLSNHVWPDAERPRIELILASTIDTELCGQILANLVFHLADSEFYPEPGVVVRDVVGSLGADDLSVRLPHVYIAVPRLWDISLPLDLGPPPVTLAQVVPISELEYEVWRSNMNQLEPSLAKRRVDLADLRRIGG
ncbi:MAG: tetratricopeptide repeat protein [Deltaproteobacteria bacterium]|nr:tetratricopeptide repeat protein [Deltaproteobacteria bacterium]